MAPPDKLLVYWCSGCSNAAQLANDAAVALDRSGLADLSHKDRQLMPAARSIIAN